MVDTPAPAVPPVPAPAPAPAPDPDPVLRPEGEQALAAWKDRAKAAEKDAKRANDAEAELAKLRAASMSDTEKAVAAAKAEGRTEALSTVNGRLLRAEVKAAAAGKLADPDDACSMIDLDQFKVGDDGNVDTSAIAKAIDVLVKAKPYLASGAKPGALPGGGATPANGAMTPAEAFAESFKERLR